jgi:hypothetical protein
MTCAECPSVWRKDGYAPGCTKWNTILPPDAITHSHYRKLCETGKLDCCPACIEKRKMAVAYMQLVKVVTGTPSPCTPCGKKTENSIPLKDRAEELSRRAMEEDAPIGDCKECEKS